MPGQRDQQAEGEPADLLADQRAPVPPAPGDGDQPGDQARGAQRDDDQRAELGDRAQVRRQAERVVDGRAGGRR